MNVLNLNVGLMGHVDSGKTTIAKTLSQVSSTAAFDKDPQSQERGITLDLGFSSFILDIPDHMKNTQYEKVQFTLVDCPGHGSLIRTVIGGARIIDMMVIVIDATKGIQTQTSESVIISEITNTKVIVVVNKTDLVEEEFLEKFLKRIKLTFDTTFFKGCPIVTACALKNDVKELVKVLLEETYIPERNSKKPFLFAIDHCFGMKGKGTVMTGTVLQGCVNVNDDIEIPSINLIKKVKSMQMFKKPVDSAIQGDRVGICVTQFDPKLVERGIACKVKYVKKVYAAIMDFTKVRFFKAKIESRSHFHINLGYENTVATILLFSDPSNSKEDTCDFDFNKEYKFLSEIDESTPLDEMKIYVLLEFTKPILVPKGCLTIGAKFETPILSTICRLAFYGHVLWATDAKNYHTEFLKNLKVYKDKFRKGVGDRMINEHEIIGKNMFKKETNIQKFVGMKVKLSTGEDGTIESPFGQSGKFKVRIPEGLKCENIIGRGKSQGNKLQMIEIHLHHKRYLFDPNKKFIQT